MDFFELKEKAGEIDGVTDDGVLENGKNQYTIEKDGYYFEIIDGVIQNIYDADIIIRFEYPNGLKGPIAKAKVTVANNKKTVDTSSIEYGWTTSREETPEAWEGTTSGAEITKDITGSVERHYLHVRAKAVGETEYTTKISSQFNDLDETEPEITLTKTEGDEEVTITANVTFGFTGGKVKWLSGDKAVGDFAEAGTEINEPYNFTVTKNGWYTVYGEGNNGLKKVVKIEVTTIVLKPKTFNYTGAAQTWTAPVTGNYKIEAWGSAGYSNLTDKTPYRGICFWFDNSFGRYNPFSIRWCSWLQRWCPYPRPGGASDVRLAHPALSNVWSDPESLRARLLVAGGRRWTADPQHGYLATASGGHLVPTNHLGGSQTARGLPGPCLRCRRRTRRRVRCRSAHTACSAEAVGGWYGGSAGFEVGPHADFTSGGGGGSSYISGHPDCVGVQPDGTSNTVPSGSYGLSVHPSGLVFTDITVTAGVHNGDGKIVITPLDI